MRRFGIYGSLPAARERAPERAPKAEREVAPSAPGTEAGTGEAESAPPRDSFGLAAVKDLLDRHNGVRR